MMFDVKYFISCFPFEGCNEKHVDGGKLTTLFIKLLFILDSRLMGETYYFVS